MGSIRFGINYCPDCFPQSPSLIYFDKILIVSILLIRVSVKQPCNNLKVRKDLRFFEHYHRQHYNTVFQTRLPLQETIEHYYNAVKFIVIEGPP